MALGWLSWRAWFPFGAVVAAAVCVEGVALGDIDFRFLWQVWHLAASTFTLRGKRGTHGTGLSLVARLLPVWRRCFCVTGVALGDINFRFCVAGAALGGSDLST